MAKGLSLPGGLYTGGAVSLNAAPYVNYYLQTQAHKQAQEDAMYRYFGELQKGLTPAGMDSQDIPGLMQKKQEWQQHMLQNRDKISRPTLDKGAAYSEAMGRYNDMLGYIEESKNKMKKMASLAPIMHNPQKHDLLTDQTWDDIRRGSLPLNHPDYKPFDPNSIDYNPAPFGAKEVNTLRQNVSLIKPTETGVTRRNLGNRMQEVTHHYGFTPDQLYAMQNQAASQYATNPSFKGFIDKIDDANGDAYHSMNDLFKNHYGRDIADKGDFATAYYLSLHPDSKSRVETRTIPMNPYEQSNITLGREKEFYDYKQQQAQAQDDEAENFLMGREQDALKGPAKQYIHNGKREDYHIINMTPDQKAKIFGQRDITGKHTLVPDEVAKFDNGDYLPIHYERDENTGEIKVGPDGAKAVDANYTKPVDRAAVKASIIANKIIPKKPIKSTAPTPTTKTKVTTKTTFGAGGLN